MIRVPSGSTSTSRSAMERSPDDATPSPPPPPPPPPLVLDDEGELKRAEANGFHLFLGNLGVEVDEAFLTRVFSKFASFVPGSARVKRQPDGTTRCYGYVTFSKRRDIDAAMAEFEGQLLGGTGPVRLSSCLYNAEARSLSPAQLRERCEMRMRLFQERFRRLNEEKHSVAAWK